MYHMGGNAEFIKNVASIVTVHEVVLFSEVLNYVTVHARYVHVANYFWCKSPQL